MLNKFELIGWCKIAEFSVGGLEWIGFTKKQPNKLLCISSQYISLIDCENGETIKCDTAYDEVNHIAEGIMSYG